MYIYTYVYIRKGIYTYIYVYEGALLTSIETVCRPIISGSFAERDLQLKALYASFPPTTIREVGEGALLKKHRNVLRRLLSPTVSHSTMIDSGR